MTLTDTIIYAAVWAWLVGMLLGAVCAYAITLRMHRNWHIHHKECRYCIGHCEYCFLRRIARRLGLEGMKITNKEPQDITINLSAEHIRLLSAAEDVVKELEMLKKHNATGYVEAKATIDNCLRKRNQNLTTAKTKERSKNNGKPQMVQVDGRVQCGKQHRCGWV